MLNSFKERQTGWLFEERVWAFISGRNRQLILRADDLQEARLDDQEGNTIAKGSLKYEKGDEAGRKMRYLVFYSHDQRIKAIVQESRLSYVA